MLHRRNFLRAVLVTVGGALAPSACREAETYVPLEDGEAFFPQSVASGDPSPDAVILWARVDDPDVDGDLELRLEVAADEGFIDVLTIDGAEAIAVAAEAIYDRCVKVKVRGLLPATTYFYRFVYAKDGRRYASRVGRTRTAPALDADVPVRFAFVSCQDYIGRYYNVYRRLAAQELDFFVHLGDYIYETTGDPRFQGGADRKISFDDAAGAIPYGDYEAARSLDNYRQLYRTIRSDRALQATHEALAMVAIWDDHEFSNDSHGATATYINGAGDEYDEARRKAANQAWFEYMPVDYPGDEDFRYDPAAPFPGDIRIYRDLRFGRHLHLVLTDLRTYRADHVVDEAGFPATVLVDEAALVADLGEVPSWATPYVDIDSYAGGSYGDLLRAGAGVVGYDPAAIAGRLDVAAINRLLADINPTLADADQLPPIDEAAQATLERGVAFATMGKTGLYSSFGSRYLVVKDAFDAYADRRFAATEGASEIAMGAAQEAWFVDTMRASDRTWKVWGNEFMLSPLQIDLSLFDLPAPFANRFYLTTDSWDGQPSRRDALLEALADVPNLVAITGDIHSFFAGTPSSRRDPSAKIVEFVTSSITTATLQRILEAQAIYNPSLADLPGIAELASGIRDFLLLFDTNPHLADAELVSNGFVTLEVDGEAMTATYHAIPDSEVTVDHGDDAAGIDALFRTWRYQVRAGERELYRERSDGSWERWDTATIDWV
ncbi:MAG: alkaline phosphatase D family protein [Nannocystaceae bacterium]